MGYVMSSGDTMRLWAGRDGEHAWNLYTKEFQIDIYNSLYVDQPLDFFMNFQHEITDFQVVPSSTHFFFQIFPRSTLFKDLRRNRKERRNKINDPEEKVISHGHWYKFVNNKLR